MGNRGLVGLGTGVPTVGGQNPAPLGNHAKPLFVGISSSSQGFLNGAKWISSSHSMNGIHQAHGHVFNCQCGGRQQHFEEPSAFTIAWWDCDHGEKDMKGCSKQKDDIFATLATLCSRLRSSAGPRLKVRSLRKM